MRCVIFSPGMAGNQNTDDHDESTDKKHRLKRAPTDVTHSISCDASLNLEIVVQHADPMWGIEQVCIKGSLRLLTSPAGEGTK